MGITLHNANMVMRTNYFSSAANQLPLSMFSRKDLLEHGLDVGGGQTTILNFNGGSEDNNLKYTANDIYNALPRMNDTLETPYYWDFTSKNMSTAAIDDNNDYTNIYLKKEIQDSNGFEYENPFKIPIEALNEANRYEWVYKKCLVSVVDQFSNENNGERSSYASFVNSPVSDSLFNPLLKVNSIGMMNNVPLINTDTKVYSSVDAIEYEQKDANSEELKEKGSNTFNFQSNDEISDISDCTIKTLVNLSKVKSPEKYSQLGMERYKWADFMYCKDLGKYSNNMLITLRKFPHPIGDNITNMLGLGEDPEDDINISPDIGRMIAWLGGDNKLEDIVRFSTEETWKELNAEDEQMENKDDTTPLGALFSLGNPEYLKAVKNGTAGSNNPILQRFTSGSVGDIMSSNAQYEGNPAMNGQHYDKNKVYNKVGTVRQTHIYEGEIKFNHTFRLVFDYELRAYENINPKSAFLDLISNILATTFRKGTFWGGSRSLYGSPGLGKNNGWKIANTLISNAADDAGSLLTHIFSGGQHGTSGKDILNKYKSKLSIDSPEAALDAVKNFFSNNSQSIGNMVSSLIQGGLANKLGRPQVYAFNSLLTGAPVGLWHVTIGNPRNPILSMGNLIIQNTEYQLYGPLGIDDFPTGLKVVVNLKHAKPRDAAEIANMFTGGVSQISFPTIGNASKNAPDNFYGSLNNLQSNGNGYGTSDTGYSKLVEYFGTTNEAKILNSMASVQGG